MPTIQSMELPVPKNWQDFEAIVRDAQAQRWRSPTLQKNGRPGQKQKGVDIWGQDEIGRPVGIQCKRYKSSLKLEQVTDEIGKAEHFKGHLTALFIATTADHDAKLQEQVRLLSDKRVAQDHFAVALLFWDDIVGSLLLNPAVFKAHYPQIQLANVEHVDKERLIAALELSYYGADLWSSITLIFGDFGIMAQADPDELIATFRILERRTEQLLPPGDAAPIHQALQASGRQMHERCQQLPPTQTPNLTNGLLITIPGDRIKRRTRVAIASRLVELPDASLKVLLHLMIARRKGKQVHKIDLGATADQGFKGISTLRNELKPVLGGIDIIKNDYQGNYSLMDDVTIGECAVENLLKIGDQTISELAKQLRFRKSRHNKKV